MSGCVFSHWKNIQWISYLILQAALLENKLQWCCSESGIISCSCLHFTLLGCVVASMLPPRLVVEWLARAINVRSFVPLRSCVRLSAGRCLFLWQRARRAGRQRHLQPYVLWCSDQVRTNGSLDSTCINLLFASALQLSAVGCFPGRGATPRSDAIRSGVGRMEGFWSTIQVCLRFSATWSFFLFVLLDSFFCCHFKINQRRNIYCMYQSRG